MEPTGPGPVLVEINEKKNVKINKFGVKTGRTRTNGGAAKSDILFLLIPSTRHIKEPPYVWWMAVKLSTFNGFKYRINFRGRFPVYGGHKTIEIR